MKPPAQMPSPSRNPPPPPVPSVSSFQVKPNFRLAIGSSGSVKSLAYTPSAICSNCCCWPVQLKPCGGCCAMSVSSRCPATMTGFVVSLGGGGLVVGGGPVVGPLVGVFVGVALGVVVALGLALADGL